MFKRMFTASVTATLLSLNAHAAQSIEFEVSTEVPLNPERTEKAIMSQREVIVPLALIDENTTTISVPLDDSRQLVLHRIRGSRGLEGVLTWSGEGSLGNERFKASLVFGPQHAFGLVNGSNRQWRLSAGTAGTHLWQTMDPLSLQRATADDVLLESSATDHQPSSKGLESPIGGGSTAITWVDVLIAVDARLHASYPEAVVRAEHEVNHANTMFLNSQTGVQLRLVGVQLLSDVPNTTTPLQLLSLKGREDGAMDTVHRVRDGLGADIVVLVSRSFGPVCGVASSLMPTADEAFATVNGASQCDDRLFAHEVGHLFSAEHDPETANNPQFPTTSTKPYARGFKRNLPGKHAPQSYATIMTYNGSDSCIIGFDLGQPIRGICQPAPFFSNPQLLDEFGYPTGTALQNNARAIREEAARVAAFRSPPSPAGAVQTGSWHNPDRTGHGILISRAQQGFLATWYTFRADGTPVWYFSGVAPLVNGSLTAGLFRAERNPVTGAVTVIENGDVRLRLLSAHRAIFEWDFHDLNGNGASFDGSEYVEYLFGGGPYEGQWYQPAENGWGLNISQSGDVSLGVVFYYHGSEPAWVVSSPVSAMPVNNSAYPLLRYTTTGLCPGCFAEPRTRNEQPAGIMYLNLGSAPTAVVSVQTQSGFVWQRGTFQNPAVMARLTLP